MAGLKIRIAAVALVAALAGFGLWQWRAGIRKQARIEAQAESIERLKRVATEIDAALLTWRNEHAAITRRRQENRELAAETARADPAFQNFLDLPLPPALLPVSRGGLGLLGGHGRATRPPAPGAAAADALP